MRTIVSLLVVALVAACSKKSPTEPPPCEPMPYCEAFKNDIAIGVMIPLPYGYTCGDTIPPGSECKPEDTN